MNSQVMSDYIQFVADRLLVALGYEKIFQVRRMLSNRARVMFFLALALAGQRSDTVLRNQTE